MKLEMWQYIESIASVGNATPCVNYEEKSGNCFCHATTNGGTCYAQNWKTEVTKYEGIVKNNVAKHHHYGVERECTGVSGGYKEGTEHQVDKGKEETINTPMQIAISCLVHTMGTYEML